MNNFELTASIIIGKRIKNRKLTDVSILVKECKLTDVTSSYDELDPLIELDVVWMNDLYEMEIGPDTIYIKPDTLSEWYIYEPIQQAAE